MVSRPENPMRICLISPVFPPDFGWDGTARASYELALGLKAKGHEVEVIAFGQFNQSSTKQDGLVVHRLAPAHDSLPSRFIQATTPRSRYGLNTSMTLWRKFLSLEAENPFDVVDSSAFVSEPLIPSLLGATPVVARVFETAPEYIKHCLNFAGTSAFAFDARLDRQARRASILLSDCAVADCQESLSDLKEDLAGVDMPVRRILPALDLAKFATEGEKALDTGGRVTLIVRGKVKDPFTLSFLKETLKRVVDAHPHLCVAVAAEDVDSEEREEDVKKTLEAAGIKCDVTINSKISRALMPQILNSADICLIPSRSDLSPYVFLDAMALTNAVVVCNQPKISDYLKNNENGIVFSAGDSNGAASSINSLIDDRERLQSIRRRGRASVEQLVDRDEILRQTIELYSELIETVKEKSGQKSRAARLLLAMEECGALSRSYERMIYDLLYSNSWRFKVNHWIGRLSRSQARVPAE